MIRILAHGNLTEEQAKSIELACKIIKDSGLEVIEEKNAFNLFINDTMEDEVKRTIINYGLDLAAHGICKEDFIVECKSRAINKSHFLISGEDMELFIENVYSDITNQKDNKTK